MTSANSVNPLSVEDLKSLIESKDSQERLRAIVALRQVEPETAVPLLLICKDDPVFMVRSFVAMGLGRKQDETAYAALQQMLESDPDHNVRAEAANSLALYGPGSTALLLAAFHRDDNWLVRRSILAAMGEFPDRDALWEMCQVVLDGEDVGLREAAIGFLALLVGTSHEAEALEQLLGMVGDLGWNIRYRVALSLRNFSQPQAQSALEYLCKDEDARVAEAASAAA